MLWRRFGGLAEPDEVANAVGRVPLHKAVVDGDREQDRDAGEQVCFQFLFHRSPVKVGGESPRPPPALAWRDSVLTTHIRMPVKPFDIQLSGD